MPRSQSHTVCAKHYAYLLTETDAGSCVERQEDERVRGEVLLHALVDEAVGVPAQGCCIISHRQILSEM